MSKLDDNGEVNHAEIPYFCLSLASHPVRVRLKLLGRPDEPSPRCNSVALR